MEDDQKEIKQQIKRVVEKRQHISAKKLKKIIAKGARQASEKIGSGRPDLIELPAWLPDASVVEFYTAQDTLHKKYSDNESIIKLMDEYNLWYEKIESNPEGMGPPPVPVGLSIQFATVCRVQRAASIEPKEGRKIIFGDESEKTLKKQHQSERGRNRKKNSFHQLIESYLSEEITLDAYSIEKKLESEVGKGIVVGISRDRRLEYLNAKNKPRFINLTSSLSAIVSKIRDRIKKTHSQ